jgi:hypothetical protein
MYHVRKGREKCISVKLTTDFTFLILIFLLQVNILEVKLHLI